MTADDRISCGVPGLDEMLGGGLIRSRPYVVSGTTGSGKTMLSMQFLQQGVRQGERSLLVAIDEPPSEIRENVRALGWDVGKIRILDAHPSAKAYSKRVSLVEVAAQRAVGPLMEAATSSARADAMKKASPELSIQSLQLMLQQELRDSKYTRVAIDSLTSLKKLSGVMNDLNMAIRSLLRFLSESGVTSIIVTDIPEPTELEPEMFVCRGEIRLYKQLAMGKIDRCVTVEKMRGSAHDMYPRPMLITEKGIAVDPRRRIARSLLKELQEFTRSAR